MFGNKWISMHSCILRCHLRFHSFLHTVPHFPGQMKRSTEDASMPSHSHSAEVCALCNPYHIYSTSFSSFCHPRPQQQEYRSSIMSPNINERTYIMVKVQPHFPPLLTHRSTDDKDRLGHLCHRSPTASSEVSSATSSRASRSVDLHSSPSSSSTLPPHTSRSVSPVTCTWYKHLNSSIWISSPPPPFLRRLRSLEGHAIFPRPSQVHDLGPCSRHGLARSCCCQDRSCDAWRNRPAGLFSRFATPS
jgi:hypothetical protein